MSVRIRRLVPLAPGASAQHRVAASLRSLLTARRPSRRAERLGADLEHLLMRVLVTSGTRGVERVMKGVTHEVPILTLTDRRRGLRAWRVPVPERKAELHITVTNAGGFRTTSAVWWPARPVLTPRQAETHEIQTAFYDRYLAAGKRAYATPPRSLARADRTILLVGELEADVNNGGFRQYLDNKGRRRARSALSALRRIGATRTAELLEAALRSATSSRVLERLDRRFARGAEDLAVLAMRDVER